jgi:hypothetical protein
MTVSDPGSSGPPLTSDQVLNELDVLATVEHALIVEYLTVQCALGYTLAPGDGGPVAQPAIDAASVAGNLAQGAMFSLAGLNGLLIQAGRSPEMGRASSISSASVPEVSLAPPGLPELQQLLTREDSIARAVDERYARLAPAVVPPVFEEPLLSALQALIAGGQSHADGFAGFTQALGSVAPADVLRATRRDASGDFEQSLLEASDRAYALTVAVLTDQFNAPPFSADSGNYRQLAYPGAMRGLDDMNCVLVQRGLLPPFTI